MVSNDAAALQLALKNGRTVASNGPQLALQVEQRNPGDTLTLPQGGKRVHYRAALRSPVAIDHLEIVHNGRLVAAHRFGKVRTQADIEGDLTVRESGWLVLRAWNEGAVRRMLARITTMRARSRTLSCTCKRPELSTRRNCPRRPRLPPRVRSHIHETATIRR